MQMAYYNSTGVLTLLGNVTSIQSLVTSIACERLSLVGNFIDISGAITGIVIYLTVEVKHINGNNVVLYIFRDEEMLKAFNLYLPGIRNTPFSFNWFVPKSPTGSNLLSIRYKTNTDTVSMAYAGINCMIA